jgi:integrase
VVSRPTLAEFSKEFLSTSAVNNNKPSSIESKRYMLGMHFVPALGRRRLDEIGQKEIETYKSQKLKEGLSPKSINNQLATLHKLLDVAVDWGILEHVPRVKWLRGPKTEFDFLTFDETDRLLAAAEPRWFPMIALVASGSSGSATITRSRRFLADTAIREFACDPIARRSHLRRHSGAIRANLVRSA